MIIDNNNNNKISRKGYKIPPINTDLAPDGAKTHQQAQ